MKFDTSLAEALKLLEKERGITVQESREALEAALLSAYQKAVGSEETLKVLMKDDLSEVDVYAAKEVVEGQVEDPHHQISLVDAQEIDPNAAVGQEVLIKLEVPAASLGRLATQAAKQAITQKLRDAERKAVLEEYADRVGQVVTGTVQRLEKNNVIVKLGRSEAVLTPTEQIPGETYRVGDRLKMYVVEVRDTMRGPQLVLSRSHEGLVRKLFELEIPEINDGTVKIRAITREAGYRTKMAVVAIKPNVDPVGACIGSRGSRIQNIVAELKGEKIDVIRWSDNLSEFVAAALSPAKVLSVRMIGERAAHVTVPDTMLSLAIGRDGQNVRLAARLTDCHIDIESESQARQKTIATG